MVRLILTIAVACVLGVTFGAVQYAATYSTVEERFAGVVATFDKAATSNENAPKPAPAARAEGKVEVVGGSKHMFGSMQQGSKKKHTFILKNVGSGPLELKVVGSSCKCTIGSLENSLLQPGEETGVALEWKAIGVLDHFGQNATIGTSDPQHPQVMLSVEGDVIRTVLFEPESVTLNEVSVTDKVDRKLYMFSYAEKPIESLTTSWTDTRTAGKVTIAANLVPVDTIRFPQHAKATSAAEVDLHIEPGLPLGALESRVHFKTNLEQIEEFEVPVTATIVGDVEIVAGSKFESDSRILNIGKVAASEGQELRFYLSVQGEFKDSIAVSILNVVPKESLIVTVGEPIERSTRKLFPIICTIPAGAPPATFPGTNPSNFGRIDIGTTHPNIPKLPIHVRLVVE